MLTGTFCHIPGIGGKTERNLWAAGVTSWDAFLDRVNSRSRSPSRLAWVAHVQESLTHYSGRSLDYFAERLPSNQHWRLFHDLQDSCAFVDIETTGFGYPMEITTIALYDGRSIRYYVNGRNLRDFVQDVRDYRLLVTYNGKCFDVPILEGQLGARLPVAHVDLRYTLKSLGLSGGLKECERQLGMCRAGMENVDGFVAVLLWREYLRRKDERALETLLAYNIQDVVNLHALMIHAYNEKVRDTPFGGSHTLPPCVAPSLPFTPDGEIVRRLTTDRFTSFGPHGLVSALVR
jgi:hypothetical protein